MTLEAILPAAVTLFFVMDPLGNIPVFNAILARYPARRRSRIVARELCFALIILLLFLFAGNGIMAFLGLTQPSLSLAGGILLFIIALRMIFPVPAATAEGDVDSEPFIVPLATPMIAGPSTLAMLLLLSSSQPARVWEWSIALLAAWFGTTLILAASPLLMRVLGARGLRAVERLMGMLLVLMAIQMVLNGTEEFVMHLLQRGAGAK